MTAAAVAMSKQAEAMTGQMTVLGQVLLQMREDQAVFQQALLGHFKGHRED